MKKRLLTVLLAFVMMTSFMPLIGGRSDVYAAYAEYNYYNSASDYQIACTWYAWKQAQERIGVTFPDN